MSQESYDKSVDTQEFVLSLPGENEVIFLREERLSLDSSLLQRTIRYRSGIEVMLVQDFEGTVYSVSIKSGDRLFKIRCGTFQLV